ncbi:MAG TPA: YceI family protein [Thermomicrobiales bacterium]|nr:YceI family protein [Thermomicrobiales bacterium]
MTDTVSRATTAWQIDVNHSVLEFAVRHMMITTVKGRFDAFTGIIDFDIDDIRNSRVDVTIQTDSINTTIAPRDNHLRSADFFDVDRYPTATYRSTRIEGTIEAFTIYGDLTIKDVTRPVVLAASYQGRGVNPAGVEVAGFEARGAINRMDFGLTWNQALEGGGVLVKNEVTLNFDIQAKAI